MGPQGTNPALTRQMARSFPGGGWIHRQGSGVRKARTEASAEATRDLDRRFRAIPPVPLSHPL